MSLGIQYTSYCRLDTITLLSADSGGPIYDIYDRGTGLKLNTIVLPPNDNVFPVSRYKVSRYRGGKGGSQFIGLIVQSNGESQEIEIPCEPAPEVRRGRVRKDAGDNGQPTPGGAGRAHAVEQLRELSPAQRRAIDRLVEAGEKNPDLREEMQRRVLDLLTTMPEPPDVELPEVLEEMAEAILESPALKKLIDFIYPEIEPLAPGGFQHGYPVGPGGPQPCCWSTPNAHKSGMWFYKPGGTSYLSPFDGEPEDGMVFWRFDEDMFDEPPWLWHDPERLRQEIEAGEPEARRELQERLQREWNEGLDDVLEGMGADPGPGGMG